MLSSKERAKLRSQASKEDAILQVGKGGISDNLIKQVDDALTAREIVKLTVLETSPESVKEAAESLALATNSEVVNTIGFKIVLYRKNPEKKKEAAKKKPSVKVRKIVKSAADDSKRTRSPGKKTVTGKTYESKRTRTEYKGAKPENKRSRIENKSTKPENKRMRTEYKGKKQ